MKTTMKFTRFLILSVALMGAGFFSMHHMVVADTTPTATLTATPSTISSPIGGNVTLTWSSTNTTSCSQSATTGGSSATSGSTVVNVTHTTTYILTCYDPNAAYPWVDAQQTVTVGSSAPALSATLTVSPASIASGNSTLLTWTSSNASSCSINNGVGTVSPTSGGSISVKPTTTTTYTITCSS